MFEKRAPYIGIIILSNVKQQYGGCINCIYIYIYIYTQGISGAMVNILGGGSMDCFE